MSRKLRNSIAALLLASTVCTLGAVSLAAVPFGVRVIDGAQTRAALKSPAMGGEAGSRPAGESHRPRRMRPSVGMPYFSFVPRG